MSLGGGVFPRLAGRVRGQLSACGGYMGDLKRERCRSIRVGGFPREMGQRSSLGDKGFSGW